VETAPQETKLAAEKAATVTEEAMRQNKLTAEKAAAAAEEAMRQNKLAAEKEAAAAEEAMRQNKLAAERAAAATEEAMRQNKLAAEKASLEDEQAARKVTLLQSMGLSPKEIQRRMLRILDGTATKRHTPSDNSHSQPRRRSAPEERNVDDQLAALAHEPYHGKRSLSHIIWEQLVADEATVDIPNPFPSMADAFRALHRVYLDDIASKNRSRLNLTSTGQILKDIENVAQC
jgi:hypothetical protein